MTARRPLPTSPAQIVALTATVIALWLAAFPPIEPASAARALALAVFAVGLWGTGAVPESVTALVFFLVAMLFEVAPPAVIFSGFHSTALWLIFGGLVVAVAVKRTGLGERIARGLSGSFGSSYLGIIAGVVAVGVTLGFLMPSSTGRVVLVLPIALALADHFGFEADQPGRTGIVLAAVFGADAPTFSILPANVPNLVFAGAAETLYGFRPLYGQYLLLHFPVLGVLKAGALALLIAWLYHDRPAPRIDVASPAPMSRDERRLAVLLILALGFWVTDFAHHVSPAWISLAAAVVCLLPITGLVPQSAFNQQINFGSLFFVAGVMGFGAVMAHSGLGSQLASGLLAVLPLEPDAAARNFFSLAGMATLMGVVTTLPGTPAVLTPLAEEMARAAGMPLESVLMTQVLGFSTVLLPYQSAPLVVGMQIANEPLTAALKVAAALAAITVLVLFPLDFLWWRVLGWI